MNRARVGFAVTLAATALFANAPIAAQTQAPVLAGKKFTPPLRGEAAIEWARPVTKRDKDMVITTILVRNASTAPIARLTINETWYDKAGTTVIAGRGVINGLLQPGEIQTVVINTPWKAGMLSFQRRFSHAYGIAKPQEVKRLELPKDPAATPAAATKK